MKPKALLFDVFGTCVDWRSGVSAAIERHATAKKVTIDNLAFADAWRAKYQPAMERIRSGERPYTDLDILHRENLEATLADFGQQDRFDEEELRDLNRAWENLPPWRDTIPGLTALKKRFIIASCSNGSVALTTRLSKYAGLPWDCVLGAGIARAYKPDPQAYLKSCAALQLEAAEVMMVAAHNDDLAAARALGMPCMFVPRPTEYGSGQLSDLRPADDWEFIATDFVNAATQLAA